MVKYLVLRNGVQNYAQRGCKQTLHTGIQDWERIYLTEGAEGFAIERLRRFFGKCRRAADCHHKRLASDAREKSPSEP